MKLLNSNKVSKVTTLQIPNTSILDYINASGSAFGSMGFSNSSDAPSSTGEYAVLWFGSQSRIVVIANQYPLEHVYIRSIYNDKWHGNWANLH